MREFETAGVDGLLVVMLTYGPGMRVARALSETRLPICLANIQPVPEVTADWDMADLTYNQGIHGAQDTANAMVRARRPLPRHHRRLAAPTPSATPSSGGRASARAITAWRSLRVAVFGYPMTEMGDIRVDEGALLRALGPQVAYIAPGDLYRGVEAVEREAIDAALAEEDERFEIDPALSAEEREDHIRMQVALERILRDRGCRAYSTHFDAIAEDGRFARLPMAAASTLMAKGFGFAGEGDALTAALVAAGHELLGDAHFTEMYAMDFPSDSILMSHMGEGNWRVARTRPQAAPDQAPARHRRAGRPAHDPLPVPAGAGHARHAALARRRSLPPHRLRGRGARHRGAAQPRDALRAVPARLRRPRLPRRLAAARRPAPPGHAPRAPARDVARVLRAHGDRARDRMSESGLQAEGAGDAADVRDGRRVLLVGRQVLDEDRRVGVEAVHLGEQDAVVERALARGSPRRGGP